MYLLLYSYTIDKGICYLVLTDKSYPKRLAFLFLEDIAKDFESELISDHGDDWLRTVETTGRQYAFIKFDRIIQRKRREFSDPNSSVNNKKVFIIFIFFIFNIVLIYFINNK